jgi:hypothetical protein
MNVSVIAPIVESTGDVAYSYDDLLFDSTGCAGNVYLWTSGVVVKHKSGGKNVYYYGLNQPISMQLGVTLPSTDVCNYCSNITNVSPSMQVYPAATISQTAFPFTLPVAFPLQFVAQ